MRLTNCNPRIDWFGLIIGFGLFAIGVLLTMTFVGAVIGIPLLLMAMGLLTNHTTMRGTPCSP